MRGMWNWLEEGVLPGYTCSQPFRACSKPVAAAASGKKSWNQNDLQWYTMVFNKMPGISFQKAFYKITLEKSNESFLYYKSRGKKLPYKLKATKYSIWLTNVLKYKKIL